MCLCIRGESRAKSAGRIFDALGPQMIQGGFHADRVPEHDRIGDQAERAKLVFLTLAIRLSDFAALAVADGPGSPDGGLRRD